ncbi:MAG: NAD(P)-dependent alcohol dehydrogenase [Actinobacteria bacterium]|nr:NAD(P)-dependent alcohol dehydrogenase [Actinomycetota bacterium]
MTASTPRAASSARPIPELMRAAVQDRYGDSDTIGYAEVSTPTPGEREVLLQVHAAGVCRANWHLMTGLPYLMRLAFGLRRPAQRVPGTDVSGRVVALGPGVDDLKIGDEVLGIGIGSFAPFARARADKLVRRPSVLSPVEAAAVVTSAMTAYRAVAAAGLSEGQKVLVLGASGGVGSYVVQLARTAGAHVTGVASAAKADLVRSLGAERVLDYAIDDPTSGAERYDAIIDMGGRRPLGRLRRALTDTGTLVIVGGEGGGRLTGGFGRQLAAPIVDRFTRQHLAMVMGPEHRDAIAPIVAEIEAGRVKPVAGATYLLGEVGQALDDLGAGRIRGTAVITIGES